MRRRDARKIMLQNTACERLLELFLAEHGSRPKRREVRRMLFTDCPGITEAIFERAWNEASRRAAAMAPATPSFLGEQGGAAHGLRGT